MKKLKQKISPEKSRASIILGIVSALFIALTVLLIFLFREYLSDAEAIRAFIERNYVVGAICMVLLCAVQVVVALVPGEVVEIACGYAFGAVGGTLVCLIGITLGSIAVILLVRKFGRKFVYTFYPKEKIDNIKWLSDKRKRNTLTLIVFLIPGTPKDLLTYAIGLTDMSIPVYLLLTTAARLPSVVTSTLRGAAVGDEQYTTAVIVFAVTAVLSIVGILIYNIVQKKHNAQAVQAEKAEQNAAPADLPSPDEKAE